MAQYFWVSLKLNDDEDEDDDDDDDDDDNLYWASKQ